MKDPLNPVQLPIRAVRMAIFPTYDTLEDAMRFAESQLPIKDKNTLCSIIFGYHNSLLKQQEHK